jgi:TonB family protein
LHSKSKSLNSFYLHHPWLASAVAHAFAVIVIVVALFWHYPSVKLPVDMTIIEMPKMAVREVTLSKPRIEPKIRSRQVYGISRKAVTTDSGLDVKPGNTLAKTPDLEKLQPTDADSLPVPTEDYLVTQMPELSHEVFVPYPPAAKKRGVQGAVIMELLIDAAGNVRQAKLVDGPDPELNSAALSAAQDFKFKPAYLQQKPVAVRIRYSYKFVIKG